MIATFIPSPCSSISGVLRFTTSSVLNSPTARSKTSDPVYASRTGSTSAGSGRCDGVATPAAYIRAITPFSKRPDSGRSVPAKNLMFPFSAIRCSVRPSFMNSHNCGPSS